MIAAARYGVPLVAPKQYEPGAQQLARIERTAALELEELRLKARPKPKAPRPIHPFADEEMRW